MPSSGEEESEEICQSTSSLERKCKLGKARLYTHIRVQRVCAYVCMYVCVHVCCGHGMGTEGVKERQPREEVEIAEGCFKKNGGKPEINSSFFSGLISRQEKHDRKCCGIGIQQV